MHRTIRVGHLTSFTTIIGLALTLLAPPAAAQTAGANHTTLHQALARLRPGTPVRVQQHRHVVQGTLARLTRDDVVLVEKQAEHRLSLGQVDTLWVSRRGRAGKGALVGGLAGLGIGLLVGAVAAPAGSDTPGSAYAAIGGGIGLLGGAVLGGLGGPRSGTGRERTPKRTDRSYHMPIRSPCVPGILLLAAATLAGCSEPEINSGGQVEIELLNSTGLSNLIPRCGRDDMDHHRVTSR